MTHGEKVRALNNAFSPHERPLMLTHGRFYDFF